MPNQNAVQILKVAIPHSPRLQSVRLSPRLRGILYEGWQHPLPMVEIGVLRENF